MATPRKSLQRVCGSMKWTETQIFFRLLLAAVSPAVIIPCLFELQDLGYGVNKGIDTLVIAAATLNDIICIALFGIVIGTIFNTGTYL